MRSSGHEQHARASTGQQSPYPMVGLGRGGQAMSLIEDNEIPARPVRTDRLLHRRVHRGKLQGHDPQVVIE